jgi:hypothetical protein
MQCVERDLITLDEDVGSILPEFEDAQLLSGWTNSGEPIFVETEKITLRYAEHVTKLGVYYPIRAGLVTSLLNLNYNDGTSQQGDQLWPFKVQSGKLVRRGGF